MATTRKYDPNRESWGAIRKLPSGRLQASYPGPDGRRHNAPATFDTVIDARTWLGKRRTEIATDTWRSPEQIEREAAKAAADQAERSRTLDDYARTWIETRTSRSGEPLRETTRVEYLRMLDSVLQPLRDLPLDAITPGVVRTWYSAVVKSGRKTTAARAYGLLRSVMHTAVGDKIVIENPCSFRGAQNASTGRKVSPPTEAELAIIESTITERYRAMVAIAGWGGLRYGELTELRLGDLMLDDDIILLNVTRAVTKVNGGFRVGPPKSSAGVRVVALPPQITRTVVGHLKHHVGPGDDALLFPARGGGHLGESSFVKHWYPARAAAGREDMPWHALRHHSITRYARAGATPKENMLRHGQVTASTNMNYQHATGRDAALAARMMAAD